MNDSLTTEGVALDTLSAGLGSDSRAQTLTQKPIITPHVLVLGVLFTTFLIAANVAGFKIVEINLPFLSIHFPAGLIFFPLTYFFDDTLTEVYGFKVSRLIIWTAFFCNILFVVSIWASTNLPSASSWTAAMPEADQAYKLVFASSSRIMIASMIAYFSGEFFNSIILAKLKILTSGKYFFLRIISSTVVGAGLDTVIFSNVAFWGIFSSALLWEIIFTEYIFKVGYEIVMLPVTYKIAAYLKRLDQVDHYDFNTRFNLFSLSLNR
jgi:uncharacterized integral membrane protein (TIGR00697 family)